MAISLKQSKSLSPKSASRLRRQARGRKKIFGYPERPRLVVTKSSKHTLVQIVDDTIGRTLVSGSTMETEFAKMTGDKSEKAAKLGAVIAERAKKAGVEQVVFDRAGHKYHGRIAALADGAREAGLVL